MNKQGLHSMTCAMLLLCTQSAIAQASNDHSAKKSSNTILSTVNSVRQITQSNSISELIIIDQAVPDKHLFYQNLKPGVAIQEITADKDGLNQLNQILRQYHNLDALHIVSHADDGVIYLGNSKVTEQLLNESLSTSQVDIFSNLNGALKQGGDLLFYGCNLAKTEKGKGLLTFITNQTNIDVAASNDQTGSVLLAGDWDLEINSGNIDVSFPFSENALKDFSGVLGTVNLSGFAPTGPAASITTTDFTLTGYVDSISENVAVAGGNAYIDSGIGNTTSYLYVDGNGGGSYPTFSLTGVNVQDFNDTDTTDIYVVGVKTTGGTITSTSKLSPLENVHSSFTFTSGDDFSDPAWGDLTGFKVYFTTFSNDTAAGFEFVNFTIDAAVPVSANEDPVISVNNGNLDYTENDDVTQLDSSATLSDADGDADWDGGTLAVQITANNEASDEISIPDNVVGNINTSGTNILDNLTVIGTLSANEGTVTNDTVLTITFNSNVTNALVQSVLQAIDYSNTSDDPSTSNRTITITATDTNGAIASDTRTITVTAVNDKPTLSATGGNPSFTEGDGVVSLFSSTTASTIESAQTLTAVVMTVTDVNDGASEVVSFDGSNLQLTNGFNIASTATNGLNVSVALVSTTATISFSGASLTTAALQTLVDTLSYSNSSQDPNTSNRVITITSLTDSGGNADTSALAVSSTVAIAGANDTPTDIALTSTSINQNVTNTGADVGLISSTDVDSISFTYTLETTGSTCTGTNGADNSSFQINADGVTFETSAALVAASYSVCMQTDDGSATYQEALSITVTDNVGPVISAVSIPNISHKVGDIVSATITVVTDSDDYTSGSGGISGTINGYSLSSFSKSSDTSYSATFTIANGGADVAAGVGVPVSVTLTDSTGNNSSSYSTAISQPSDAIYANLPTINLTADSNTIAEDGGISTLTATLSGSLNDLWPIDVTTNLAYTGTATTVTDYSKSGSIVISAGNSSNTATVTGVADTVFDAAAGETVIVDISSISVGSEGTTNQQTITITDAESAPQVTLLVGSSPIDENAGSSTITASLSTATYANVTVNLDYSGTATGGGTDYNTPSSSITIIAGNLTENAATGITAVNNDDADGDQTIVIDVASVSGGSASESGSQQQTITITDDDDGSAPVFDITPSLSNTSAEGAVLSVNMDEEGTVYYLIVDNGAATPTAAQVKAGANYNSVTAYTSGNITTSGTVGSRTITGLSDGVDYDVYVVGEDNFANLQSNIAVVKLALTTLDTLSNITSITVSGSPAETATSVSFVAVFADDVTNVTTTDFTATLVSGETNIAPTISSISGSGTTYNVTVNTGVTIGQLRLDLNASTDVVDENSNTPDAYLGGEVHTVDTNNAPTASEATNNVGPFIIDEDIKTALDLSDLLIADGNDDLLTVTVSVDNGLLFAADGNTTVNSTTISGSASNGSSSINLTGLSADINNFLDNTSRFSFQTDENDTTSVALTIIANDNLEASSALIEIIAINAINDAPTINGTPVTSLADGNAYSFIPTATDVDGDTPLVFSITNKPSWALFDSETGALTGNPQPTDVGTTTDIVIRVEDPSGDGNDLTGFDLTITSSNSAPVISGTPTMTTSEDEFYSFTPTVNDLDSGDSKTFTIVNKPSWATLNPGTGQLSGIPLNSNLGTTSNIVITVADGMGAQDSLDAFNLTVTNVNDAPIISGTPITSVAEDTAYSFLPTVTDEDSGDTKIFSILNKPSWATFSTANGLLSGTPENDAVGVTSGIIISVTDGSGASTSLAAFDLAVTNVNDAPVAENDSVTMTANSDDSYTLNVLANDHDDDGDDLVIEGADTDLGIVSVVANELLYQADADFIGTVTLTYSINDGHNARDSAVVTFTIDDVVQSLAPVIVVPDDIIINATGLYTKVATGTATATDQNGVPIAVSLVDNNLQFSPGVHELYWQATDALGIRSVASQQVIVHPLVSLSKDQLIHESTDAAVQVQVILNGQAPSYPISLPYSITIKTGSVVNNVIDGDVTISEGQLATISLSEYQFAAGETVTVTLASSVNLGDKSSSTVTISEDNIAPVITYIIEQSGETRQVVSQEDGLVTITATITDTNSGDTVTVVWGSDILINTDNDQTIFSFAPESYAAGAYSLTAVATDDGSPSLSVEKHIFVDIKDTLAVLSNDQDTDGDNIPDMNEGYGDDDGDGIPNYQDSQKLETCNVIPETLNTQTQFLVEGEPGICLRKGTVSINSIQGGLLLDEVELALVDPDAKNVGGLFDYIAYGLPQAGQVYKIVFPQLLPVPRGAVYRKFSNASWVDFVIAGEDKLMSAIGEQGYCPPPGSDKWVEGLQENSWCVQLQIQDGGPNDDDGIANGTIIDPGGVSVLLANANTFPIAEDDSASLIQNNEVTVAVLDNDSDVDSDPLAVANASVNFGTVEINDQQSITYTPTLDFVGNDIINYTISDGNGGTAIAKVNITVMAPDEGVVRNKSHGGSMAWFITCGLFLIVMSRKYDKRVVMLLLAGLSFNSQANEDAAIENETADQIVITSTGEGLTSSDVDKWSIAVNTGISQLHGSSNLSGIAADNIVDIDDKGFSWGVTLAYQVMAKWSISLGYLDLGEAETVLQSNTPNYHQTVSEVTPVFGDGIVLGLNYQFWQYSNFSSEIMAGAFAWRSQIDSTFEDVTIEHKQDGIDPYVGGGLAYALSDDWKVGLEMKRYFLDANDVDNFSLIVAYQF